MDHPVSGPRAAPGAPRASVAVLISCRDEATTIAAVVGDFAAALLGAALHVYDNNFTDGTAAAARGAGATARHEPRQGKGSVVRRMFADVEADLYVLVDGDGTYDAADAPAMVRLLVEHGLDMVSAIRVGGSAGAYRPGHRLGNALLSGIVARIFGNQITDMLSGYRVFSRRFVKSFPALATGFETETEFSVHALGLRMPVGEHPSAYRERALGSQSKLRTYADGLRILRTIVLLVKEERLLAFFAAAAAALLALALAAPVIATFLRSGLVPRLPTAVLSTGLTLLSFLALACGLILDSVARGRREARRLAYLRLPEVGAGR